MNLYQKRAAILRSARQEISRYGISAFRVEEIARILGMSKRTIYRIFPSKADLMRDCIVLMGVQVKERISLLQKKERKEPMEGVLELLEEYVNGLYNVEGVFLRELKQSADYSVGYLEIREAWKMAMVRLMEQGRQQGHILADADFSLLGDRLLTTLFESRVEEEPPHAQQLAFCRTVLRGVATQDGISRLEQEHQKVCAGNERCYS